MYIICKINILYICLSACIVIWSIAYRSHLTCHSKTGSCTHIKKIEHSFVCIYVDIVIYVYRAKYFDMLKSMVWLSTLPLSDSVFSSICCWCEDLHTQRLTHRTPYDLQWGICSCFITEIKWKLKNRKLKLKLRNCFLKILIWVTTPKGFIKNVFHNFLSSKNCDFDLMRLWRATNELFVIVDD